MNRRTADGMVLLLVASILVIGGVLTWQAYQRQRFFAQMMPMMGSSGGALHGTNPIWYVAGTLLIASVVGGLYVVVREGRPGPASPQSGSDTRSTASTSSESPSTGPIDPANESRARVLDLLPEDERRILEPVLESPGVTQIELRDRSNFSKSKVSQTVSDLEKRGLLSRERQGRTYRVYPSDDLS